MLIIDAPTVEWASSSFCSIKGVFSVCSVVETEFSTGTGFSTGAGRGASFSWIRSRK